MHGFFALVIGCLVIVILLCIIYIVYLLCKQPCHVDEAAPKSRVGKIKQKISNIWTNKLTIRKDSNKFSPRFVIPTCSPTTVACQVQLPYQGKKVAPKLDSTSSQTKTEASSDGPPDVFVNDEKDELVYSFKARGRSHHVERFGSTRDKDRSKSLPGAFRDKIRKISQDRSTTIITTPIIPLPDDLGDATLKLTYEPKTKTLHVRVVSLSNLFISANAFLGITPVYAEWDPIPAEVKTPFYLVRKIDKNLAFNDISGVMITTQLSLLPKNKTKKPNCNSEIQALPEKYLLVNQEYVFRNIDEMSLENSTLCLDILCYYGTDIEEKLIIGQVVKKLKDLRPSVTETVELEIETPRDQTETQSSYRPKDDLGELIISLGHNPLAGTLSVRLDRLTNIPDVGSSTPQIQVRLLLYFCETRIDKQQSSIATKSNHPVFDELFKFSLSREKITQSSLIIEIRHCGVVSKTNVGYVALGTCYKSLSKFHWDKLTSLSHSNLFEKVAHKITAGKPSKSIKC